MGGLNLVVINPALIIGPSLMPHLNFSLEALLRLVQGCGCSGLDTCRQGTVPDVYKGFVDVREVSEAHVLALESPDAHGRYLLMTSIEHYSEVVNMLREHPHLKHIPELPVDSPDGT